MFGHFQHVCFIFETRQHVIIFKFPVCRHKECWSRRTVCSTLCFIKRKEEEHEVFVSVPLVFSSFSHRVQPLHHFLRGRREGRGVRLTLQPAQRCSQWWTCQTSVQSTDRDESKCPLASRECVTHTHEQTHGHMHTQACTTHVHRYQRCPVKTLFLHHVMLCFQGCEGLTSSCSSGYKSSKSKWRHF